mmetsp:Transcript_38879/g.109861  ORF Transcript_38879/g.109861 Transcript_38879/m.109861 type:complete len:324 (-) Transcript_38879:47-1018(-)
MHGGAAREREADGADPEVDHADLRVEAAGAHRRVFLEGHPPRRDLPRELRARPEQLREAPRGAGPRGALEAVLRRGGPRAAARAPRGGGDDGDRQLRRGVRRQGGALLPDVPERARGVLEEAPGHADAAEGCAAAALPDPGRRAEPGAAAEARAQRASERLRIGLGLRRPTRVAAGLKATSLWGLAGLHAHPHGPAPTRGRGGPAVGPKRAHPRLQRRRPVPGRAPRDAQALPRRVLLRLPLRPELHGPRDGAGALQGLAEGREPRRQGPRAGLRGGGPEGHGAHGRAVARHHHRRGWWPRLSCCPGAGPQRWRARVRARTWT